MNPSLPTVPRILPRTLARRALALTAIGVLAGACSSQKPPEAPPEASATARPVTNGAPATQTARADVATPTSGSIAIEDRILKACGNIPQAHFAFDSAQLDPAADAALSALAQCFASGPLAGKAMRLIGHADPRGEAEYNLALGQRRAGSVATFITGHGVAPSKVAATSRGSFDATGTDDAGWARDRRVDVLLAD